jgi:hypothetical protein
MVVVSRRNVCRKLPLFACFVAAAACARPELPAEASESDLGAPPDAAEPAEAKTDFPPPKSDAGLVADDKVRPGVPDAAAPSRDAAGPLAVGPAVPTLPSPTLPSPTLPSPTPSPSPDPAEPPAGDLCRLAGRDVAILGDSFIRQSGDFTRLLQNKARSVGALGARESYVDVSRPVASMNRVPSIPAQYPEAVGETRRRGGTVPQLVIMTGGGQDVLVDSRACLEPASVQEVAAKPECVAVVNGVLETAQRLIDTGIDAGTKAAIYFFYPNLPRNSLAGGANGNSVLDYAAPLAKALCESQTRAPCYFIDLRPGFADPNNPGYPRPGLIGFDGVSPTMAGSQIIADEVWKVMQAHCLGVK